MTDLLGRPIEGDVTYDYEDNTEQVDAETFLRQLDAVLDLPDVQAVRWAQYTPYFNDGEPCVFHVYDFEVRLSSTSDDAGEDENGFLHSYSAELQEGVHYEYSDYDRVTHRYNETKIPVEGGPRPDVVEALNVIKTSAVRTVCLKAFGDHAEVVATKSGFVVESYEHD